MAAATAVRVERGSKQFQGIFSEMWLVTCTLDVASIVDGAGSTDTVDVPGVALGDMVLGFSTSVNQSALTITAYVPAANLVYFRVQNESGSTVDLASTTVKILVGRPAF
jgi:hypothetical protein